jgi:hypothetical protein
MSDNPGVSSVSSVGFRLSRSGRFSGETDPLMEQFNASIGYDKRMWRQDSEFSPKYLYLISMYRKHPSCRLSLERHSCGHTHSRMAISNVENCLQSKGASHMRQL